MMGLLTLVWGAEVGTVCAADFQPWWAVGSGPTAGMSSKLAELMQTAK